MRQFVCIILVGLSACVHGQTVSETVLYELPGNATSSLIQASDGNFYGSSTPIFKLSPAGTINFFGNLAGVSSLIQGPDGSIYGTGVADGSVNIIFKMTQSGTITILHSGSDGPYAALMLAADGNLYGGFGTYGTTPTGVFEINAAGTYTTVGIVCEQSCEPISGMVQATDGNLYGVNTGDYNEYCNGSNFCSLYFRLTPSGTVTPLSSTFGPVAGGFVEGSDGLFYATGAGENPGIYQFSTSGTVRLLAEGVSYGNTLWPGSDGNLYGTEEFGGTWDVGTFFVLTQAGALTTLCDFQSQPSCPYGAEPNAGSIQGADGNFYGTTIYDYDFTPVAYRIAVTPALPPPVQASLSESAPNPGDTLTLTWQALNAFSLTMQQCYLFQNLNGTITPLGKLTGTLSNNIFGGTTTVTPSTAAAYTYAVTCGGVESGFATVRVGGVRVPTSTSFVTNSPVTVGGQVTLTATPSTTQSVGALTGSVTYSVGSAQLGKVNLSGGSASLSILTSGIPPGTYAITATYSGDTNYLSSSTTQNVVIQGYPTAATLTTSPATVTQGQTVTLRSAVSRSGISGTPAGTVAFYYGAFELGSATLTNGVATLNFAIPTELPAGSYALTAKYSGDSLDQAAISSTASLQVIAATRTVLVVSPNPAPANTAVTFTATVSEPYGSAVPSGTVTFQVAGDKLDPVTLINGTASTTLSDIGIPAANYPLTATYSGDASNAASSGTANFVVQ